MQAVPAASIDSLADNLSSYLGKDQVNSVRRAFTTPSRPVRGNIAAAVTPMSPTTLR